MKIGVFANSSADIGEGHAMRCFNLTQAFKPVKVSWFYTSLTERTITLIENQQHINLVKLNTSDELKEKIQQFDIETIIIDDYQLCLQESLTDQVTTVVFDDLANRFIDADILIDANPLRESTDYQGYINTSCELLLNEDYMMLGHEYFSKQGMPTTQKYQGKQAGHIFFGATDPLAYSLPITQYLCEQYPSWNWRLVVTRLTPNKDECLELSELYNNLIVEYEPSSLAEGLLVSSVAIGAPGTTTWERLAAHCHCGLIASNKNQVNILLALENKGFICFLQGSNLSDHLEALSDFMLRDKDKACSIDFSGSAAELLVNKITEKTLQNMKERSLD